MGWVMAGTAATRIVSFLLLAACSAPCQQPSKLNPPDSLPDAPSIQTPATQTPTIQTSAQAPTFRAFLDTARLPVDTLSPASGDLRRFDPGHFDPGRFDPGHFEYEEQRVQKEEGLPARVPLLQSNHSYHASASSSLLSRATYAASSMVIVHDDDGGRKLNTPYLLTVLTSAVAHSAYRPYWRRSVTQPFSDFGSTVGSDAGMNVFHEFEPGILQLVKNHEPRFVSKIEEKVRR